jgi:hypothetical protein
MAVLQMPPVASDLDRARRHLMRACDDLRLTIATASAADAYAIWLHCQALTNELRTLTLRAELRCREVGESP